MLKIAGSGSMITNPAVPWANGTDPSLALGNLISSFMALLIVIGVIVFVFYIILGAIDWITAGGDKGKVEAAKQKLTNAIIGVVVLLSFFAILTAVECFFGIGLRGVEIGPFNVSFNAGGICGGGGGTTPPPPIGGSGNALCSGCITGGCGITGQVYLGAGSQNYLCTTSGWQATSAAITSSTCGTCP